MCRFVQHLLRGAGWEVLMREAPQHRPLGGGRPLRRQQRRRPLRPQRLRRMLTRGGQEGVRRGSGGGQEGVGRSDASRANRQTDIQLSRQSDRPAER
eukprot:1187133-Prorocentrum_minimum.AAC.6